MIMQRLNRQFDGRLTLAIEIFEDKYPRRFLHQLVSSQLDMDRMDYLNRDSFFTGVSEGVISSDRIIKMLNVVHDEIVVEAKGIYSIEKFLIARRLMYWQVYLHKTVIAGEQLLVKILKRSRELAGEGFSCDAVLALGEPSDEIIKLAREKDVDLIAMTTHGHRFISDILYGATADKVRHEVDVPVLLLKLKA